MTKPGEFRVTEDGRIYRSGRKKYPNGDAYSVRPANKLLLCVVCVVFTAVPHQCYLHVYSAYNCSTLALPRQNR